MTGRWTKMRTGNDQNGERVLREVRSKQGGEADGAGEKRQGVI